MCEKESTLLFSDIVLHLHRTWNSLLEETLPNRGSNDNSNPGKIIELVSLKTNNGKSEKFSSGIDEFNRVCGGGLVAGSSLLIGGEPGIGKSTLLLQILCNASSSELRGKFFDFILSNEDEFLSILNEPCFLCINL